MKQNEIRETKIDMAALKDQLKLHIVLCFLPSQRFAKNFLLGTTLFFFCWFCFRPCLYLRSLTAFQAVAIVFDTFSNWVQYPFCRKNRKYKQGPRITKIVHRRTFINVFWIYNEDNRCVLTGDENRLVAAALCKWVLLRGLCLLVWCKWRMGLLGADLCGDMPPSLSLLALEGGVGGRLKPSYTPTNIQIFTILLSYLLIYNIKHCWRLEKLFIGHGCYPGN